MPEQRSGERRIAPLGVEWLPSEEAYDFTLYSEHAESVTLLLFRRDAPSEPAASIPLGRLGGERRGVWHARVRRARFPEVDCYAYRVTGPPAEDRWRWHAFDSEKVLFDPCARGVWFPPAFDRAVAIGPGSTMGKAPLGDLRAADLHPPVESGPPRHDASDLIVYELHVRGFTRHPTSGVAPERRGTYLGLAEKIPYLQDLGVTAVELLPVFQYDPQEGNYWGYMPISFFAPHGSYATTKLARESIEEFRAMVRSFHDAGIEVILDVVYNHTGEGDLTGPVYNLKGIDNSAYYLASGDPSSPYLDFSGCGNSLNFSHAATRRLVLSSLRHWVREMGVDGFRFDLASLLARGKDGSVVPGRPPIFEEIDADPALRHVRLIAEPWDAAGLYQLGTAFPGRRWLQWNDRYRDTVRRFVRGDPGMIGELMSRVYGSNDIFPESATGGYHPYQSVNLVTSHDGFTLYDLVSYNHKHNEANGQGGQDGHDVNHSWNCGVEGDRGLTPRILALRKRQAKNFLSILLLSNGTPMIVAGDEFLRTQKGNNNPFNQDNETTWIDWRRLEEHRDVFRFAKMMIAFRKSHPSIGRSRYWRKDIEWFGVGRDVDMSYHSRSLAYCLSGRSTGDKDLYVMLNAYKEPLEFEVQRGSPRGWKRVIDTAQESPGDFVVEDEAAPLDSNRCRVASRSVVVLVGR